MRGSWASPPDLAVGVYLGFDKPRSLGDRATGGGLAAPIVLDFLKVALKGQAADPVPRPGGDQADPRQRVVRHPRRLGRGRRHHPGGVQARHRPAGLLCRPVRPRRGAARCGRRRPGRRRLLKTRRHDPRSTESRPDRGGSFRFRVASMADRIQRKRSSPGCRTTKNELSR
ncbi:protein of unknown function [Methylorubrum extorquens]|uniref:Penicillin-binding protein transpeptidase domain-containing protein n=1 Tax=Methylorubrum extorquens TaxID=408 RepID=A0A2N9AM95_METEX|nr:protein of unknown function [Methylorubrum extorquens]